MPDGLYTQSARIPLAAKSREEMELEVQVKKGEPKLPFFVSADLHQLI